MAFDGAPISFRYAEHLIRGDGLVPNPGERVSGLETAFPGLLVLLTAATQHLRRPRGLRAKAGRSLIPLAACLTRFDAVIAVSASAAATGREARRRGLGCDMTPASCLGASP